MKRSIKETNDGARQENDSTDTVKSGTNMEEHRNRRREQ